MSIIKTVQEVLSRVFDSIYNALNTKEIPCENLESVEKTLTNADTWYSLQSESETIRFLRLQADPDNRGILYFSTDEGEGGLLQAGEWDYVLASDPSLIKCSSTFAGDKVRALKFS